MQQQTFKFKEISKKQKQVLTWWVKNSPHKNKDFIVCDGAIRSGKTLIMSLSFVLWAMSEYNGMNFGMAGKTIGSFKRNVWMLLKVMLLMRGYKIRKLTEIGENIFVVANGTKENYFYIFGGKDEKSQDLVQGFTAAGFLFDEVALMPQSFVNQAVARCSVEGAKCWFNCNPENPFHWFKLEWVDKIKEKNILHLHFNLDDNPALTNKMKEKYKNMFTGVFYKRYILGLWTVAEGVIYSSFNESMIIKRFPKDVVIRKKWIGVDYGQSNATVFLLIGLGSDNKIYILDEYYHAGSESQIQKSPSTYAKDFKKWLIKNGVDGVPVNYDAIYVDPSAKGFMIQLYEEKIKNIIAADNDVDLGIKLLTSIIDNNMLRVLSKCANTIKEFGAYSWDPKAQQRGEDKPLKQNDHTMDALRYVVNNNRLLFQRLVVLNDKN